jgi:PTS system mannitol-specific IIC component
MLFGVGLTAGPSPGSIFAYLALTPPGDHVGVIAGVLVAAAVSFVITAAILKLGRNAGDEEDLAEQTERSRAMKAEGSAVLTGVMSGAGSTGGTTEDVRRIVFACDAGMGSSAMGASAFGKRLRDAGRDDVRVTHAAIESVPVDADLVVVHQDLAHRARTARPDVEIVTIQSYLGDPALDTLDQRLTERTTTDAEQ